MPPFDAPARAETADGAEVNVWVVIKPDDTCMIRIARTEMGQGDPHRTCPARRRRARMRLEEGDDRVDYRPPESRPQAGGGEQGTAGSHSVRTSQDYVRRAGATARVMLGRRPPISGRSRSVSCTTPTASSTYAEQPPREIRHDRDGRGDAAGCRPQERHAEKFRSWTLIGKPLKRLDTTEKVNGGKVFAIDIKLPPLLRSRRARSSAASSRAVTRPRSTAVAGVKDVVRVKDTAVAVVADN